MSAKTKISWADNTFNPWWGCTKVSPGCKHCYAEEFSKRFRLAQWGEGVPRRLFGEKHWAEPLKWNRRAEKAGVRETVFCLSMGDIFDAEAPASERDRLWELIRKTPALQWLLLTKRPENFRRFLPADWGDGYANASLGVTVEGKAQLDRMEILQRTPARSRFLSMEPLLEAVVPDLAIRGVPGHCFDIDGYPWHDAGSCENWCRCCLPQVDWIIVGGESGRRARPCALEWIQAIVEQCTRYGVPVFVKQLGSCVVSEDRATATDAEAQEEFGFSSRWLWRAGFRDSKGEDPSEWPENLRIRDRPDSLRLAKVK